MIPKRLNVSNYRHWRDRVALWLDGSEPEIVFLRAKVHNALGGVLEGHSATGLTDGYSTWAYSVGVKVPFADVMMGEHGCTVFRTEIAEDLDQLARFLVIVLALGKKCANGLGYDKLGLEVITEGSDFAYEGYVWTRALYERTADSAEVVNNGDRSTRYVATLLRNLLHRGERMLGMEVKYARDSLYWKAIPKQASTQASSEPFESESGLAAVRGTDHKEHATGLQPRVYQKVVGFRWRWGKHEVVNGEHGSSSE